MGTADDIPLLIYPKGHPYTDIPYMYISNIHSNIPINPHDVVCLQATKVGAPPPGPPTGPRNYSVVLDQETLAHANKTGEALKRSEVGPFAPISTQEAEVVFDVLDKRPGVTTLLHHRHIILIHPQYSPIFKL